MTSPKRAVAAGLATWTARLRFPTLLWVTASLFALDLVIPDFIPLADELLLGLATVVLARWKERRDPDESDS